MKAPAPQVCPKCPPGTPAKPRDIRFWPTQKRSADGFAAICRACKNAQANASRRKHVGVGSEGRRLFPELTNGSVWRVPIAAGCGDVVFTVISVSPWSGGFRVLGTVDGKRRTFMAAYVIANGTRVDGEAKAS